MKIMFFFLQKLCFDNFSAYFITLRYEHEFLTCVHLERNLACDSQLNSIKNEWRKAEQFSESTDGVSLIYKLGIGIEGELFGFSFTCRILVIFTDPQKCIANEKKRKLIQLNHKWWNFNYVLRVIVWYEIITCECDWIRLIPEIKIAHFGFINIYDVLADNNNTSLICIPKIVVDDVLISGMLFCPIMVFMWVRIRCPPPAFYG